MNHRYAILYYDVISLHNFNVRSTFIAQGAMDITTADLKVKKGTTSREGGDIGLNTEINKLSHSFALNSSSNKFLLH